MPDDLDFDSAAAQVAKNGHDLVQAAAVDPFDVAARQVAGVAKVRLATSVQNGQQANADSRARAMILAQQTKLPVDVVERNLPAVEAKVRASSYDLAQIQRNHPALAEWLNSPDNAAVSNDDLPGMRGIDVATRALRGDDPSGILPHGFLFDRDTIIEPLGDGSLANEYKTFGDLHKELTRRGDHADSMDMERQREASNLANRFGPAANFIAGAAGSLTATQRMVGTTTEYDHANDALQRASQQLSPGFWGDVQRGVGGVVADIPLMLSGGAFTEGVVALSRIGQARTGVNALLNATAKGQGAQGAARLSGERAAAAKELAAATKAAPLTGRAADFVKVAGASQPLAIREGVNTAQDNGAANGAAAWLIETVVPGAFGRTGAERYLVKGATEAVADGWRGFAKRLLVDAGFEGSEEAVTEWAHAVHEAASGIDPTALQPDKLWRRLAVAGTVGAAAGAGFSLPANIAEKFSRDGEEARRATVHADRLTELMNKVGISKTQQRAPQAVAEAIEKSLGQSDRFSYVDAGDFRDAYQDPATAAAEMGLGKEYAEALATGGQLKIPTSVLVQRATDDLSTAKLIEKVRRSPEARNAAEAAEFATKAPEELRRLSNEARASAESAKAAPQDSTAELQKQIEDSLVKAGHDPVRAQTNATIMARTFAALAKRSGKDAGDLYSAYLNGRIKKVLPGLMKGEKFDMVDAMLDRIRNGEVPSDRDISGPSLVDLLRTKGITDVALAGELRDIHDADKRKPGEKHLVRDDGLALDDARMLAVEKGYLSEGASINDLLAAIENELRADKPTFREGQEDHGQRAIRDALDQMEGALRGAGVDVFTATNKQAREALAKITEEQDGKSLGQGTAVVDAPVSGRLDLYALLRQWRKATGDRTPIGGDAAFQALADQSDAVDAAKGKIYQQPAYHGTPHKFDKFTTEHMGSGEGAQAYGWGLYFAGSKEVGKFYKEKLGSSTFQYDGKAIKHGTDEQTAAELLHGQQGDIAGAIEDAGGFSRVDEITAILKSWDPTKLTQGGRLYTVEIPENGEMLLWDKPLSEQPENIHKKITSLLDKNIRGEAASIMKGAGDALTGRQAYGLLSASYAQHGNDEAASKALLAAGIKGIKYLDGNSRSDGDGSHNYVIFDGADAAITEYNQPGKSTGPRGSLVFGKGTAFTIKLFQSENLSTFSHESAHLSLEILGDLATAENAAPDLVADYKQATDWFAANAADIRSQAIDQAKEKGAPADLIEQLRAASDEDIAKIAASFNDAPQEGTAAGYLHESMHEYFARGFEAYLMEGKAPTPSLRSAFARIKGWMTAIYRVISTLRVNLSPEIRGVFDRLVASEDEIDAAEQRAQTTDILPASAFPDAKTFDDYRTAVQASKERAEASLQKQLIGDYRKELGRAWKEQRGEIRTETATLVDSRPVYQVIAALQRGQMPDGSTLPDEFQGMKLDKAEILREWGEKTLKMLPGPANVSVNEANRGAFVYTDNGMPIADIAAAWGFKDPTAMIEAMIAAPDRDSLINTLTDERMRKEHPDPLVDGSLPDRADKAISGDLRGELLAREMRALGAKTGQTPAPIAVLREFARTTIENQKARDLRPTVYQQAAATAARKATEAAARQDWSTAYVEKQREALNVELWRASRDAVAAGEQGRAYLRKLDTLQSRQRIGKAGGWEFSVFDEEDQLRAFALAGPGRSFRQTNGYLEQIDAIQDGYSLRRPSNKSLRKREQFRKWISKQEADGEPVAIDPAVVDDLGQRNWNDLTVGEQAAVVDAVKNIEHLAGLKNKLLKSSRDESLAEAQVSGAESINANKKGTVSSAIGDTPVEQVAAAGKGFLGWHRKDSFLLRKMDGYEDAGVMWDLIQRPRNDAATEEETRNLVNAAAVDAAFKKWGKGLGWTRQDIDGTKLRLTLEHRVAMALNWGHAEGRRRILRHLEWEGGGEQDVQAVLDSLDAKDFEFVDELVAIINSHWSDVADLERRMSGIPPEKVKALPFSTTDKATGVVSWHDGGYYPLKYDADKSHRGGDAAVQAALKENLGTAGARGQTRRSHTKMRVEDVKGLAVELSLDVAGVHLAEVVHDLTHREMGRDQIQLLKDGSAIADAIIAKHGVGKLKQLVETAGAIATRDITPGNRASSFVKLLRRGNTAAVFTYQLASALMNLTGVLSSVARVGPLRLLSAVGSVTKDASTMEWAGKWVQDKSAMMKVRGGNNVREVSEALREVGRLSGMQKAIRFGYLPMQKVVQLVDTITWIAAYRQSMDAQLAKGKTEEDADALSIAVADQTVIDTQGSGRIGDLSAIQRGGELAKLLTMFYGYFNVQANLVGEQYGMAQEKGGAQWLRSSAVILTVMPMATILTNMIKAALRGDDRKEDAKAMAKRMALEQLSTAAGLLVGVRELSGVIEVGFGYSGPASLSVIKNASELISQVKQGDVDAGAAKALISTVGSLTGMPSRVANQVIDATLQFEKDGHGGAALRTLLFGKPLKDH